MRFQAFGRAMRRVLGAFGVLGIVVATSGRAHTTTGAIRGYVKDQNGVALVGAEVQAKNVETGVVRSATAGSDGLSAA